MQEVIYMYRKIRYESSLDWLLASNMILKCDLTAKNELSLKAFAYSDKFKIYLSVLGYLWFFLIWIIKKFYCKKIKCIEEF